jgi:hypothetical protein
MRCTMWVGSIGGICDRRQSRAADTTNLPFGGCLSDEKKKDPLAVALGRRGGLKGGVARAQALTAIERSQIARVAAESRWKNNFKRGEIVADKWRKRLTKSDAQEDTKGARMPFLRLTKGSTNEDHTTFFRTDFFSGLAWRKTGKGGKETAVVPIDVELAGKSLGTRNMTLDHDPARAANHRAPTTHLHYDDVTRLALEKAKLSGRSVVVERGSSGKYSLKVL